MKKIGKRIKKFAVETRLKSVNAFKDKLLELFKGYIKAVVIFGSISRGDVTGKSDVDVYIVFDDTRMPLKKFDEIREKIDKDVAKLAEATDPRISPQPVLALTEFWDGIRKCHPLFYNIVRDGYAVYDTGFFIPLRKLLEWGKFPATIEAAELRMETVPKRVERVKRIKLHMIAQDLYYAMVDAAQAVLMYIGIGGPSPKFLAREIRRHFVDTGLLEEKWAKMLEDVVKFEKGVEHNEIKEITGQELDKWIEQTEKYVERFEKLLKRLELEKKAVDIKKNYEVMIKASVAALKSIKKLPKKPEKLPEAFKKYLIKPGLINPSYAELFGKVLEMRKALEEKKIEKIPERDIDMSKEYVRRFVLDIRRILERPPKIKRKTMKSKEEAKK